jgi:YggT family protein
MEHTYMGNAGVFLVTMVFGFILLMMMLRFFLHWVQADFYNPVSQFIASVTTPLIRPLQSFMPTIYGMDLATLAMALALQMLELILIFLLSDYALNLPAIFFIALSKLLQLSINIFFFAILIQAIFSWISPASWNPVTIMIHQLCEPVLRPAKRLLPPMNGLDLSPILVLVALQLAEILIIAPLSDLGRGTLL